MDIRVSVPWAMKCWSCSEEYIVKKCQGACCRRSGGGILVAVLSREEKRLVEKGCTIQEGVILPDERGLCPFQSDIGLCHLHGDGKPFGCIISPWALNTAGTLICRYRYSRMKCFGKGNPAHDIFRSGLEYLFG